MKNVQIIDGILVKINTDYSQRLTHKEQKDKLKKKVGMDYPLVTLELNLPDGMRGKELEEWYTLNESTINIFKKNYERYLKKQKEG